MFTNLSWLQPGSRVFVVFTVDLRSALARWPRYSPTGSSHNPPEDNGDT